MRFPKVTHGVLVGPHPHTPRQELVSLSCVQVASGTCWVSARPLILKWGWPRTEHQLGWGKNVLHSHGAQVLSIVHAQQENVIV